MNLWLGIIVLYGQRCSTPLLLSSPSLGMLRGYLGRSCCSLLCGSTRELALCHQWCPAWVAHSASKVLQKACLQGTAKCVCFLPFRDPILQPFCIGVAMVVAFCIGFLNTLYFQVCKNGLQNVVVSLVFRTPFLRILWPYF